LGQFEQRSACVDLKKPQTMLEEHQDILEMMQPDAKDDIFRGGLTE